MACYEPLYLEIKHLNSVFKGEISNIEDILKKEIISENFELGNEQYDDDIIYRCTEPGRETEITCSYSRRLNVGNDFNDYECIQEEIDFFKEGNHSIFIKNRYVVKVKFLEDNLDKVKEIIINARNRINKNKKIIALEFKTLREGNEIINIFRQSPDIKHEIYFAYKVLRDYISKGL